MTQAARGRHASFSPAKKNVSIGDSSVEISPSSPPPLCDTVNPATILISPPRLKKSSCSAMNVAPAASSATPAAAAAAARLLLLLAASAAAASSHAAGAAAADGAAAAAGGGGGTRKFILRRPRGVIHDSCNPQFFCRMVAFACPPPTSFLR